MLDELRARLETVVRQGVRVLTYNYSAVWHLDRWEVVGQLTVGTLKHLRPDASIFRCKAIESSNGCVFTVRPRLPEQASIRRGAVRLYATHAALHKCQHSNVEDSGYASSSLVSLA